MGDVPSHMEVLDQEMIQWCQGTRHGLSILTLWSSLRKDIFHVTDPATLGQGEGMMEEVSSASVGTRGGGQADLDTI